MRTSGAGNESLMTVVILLVALGASIVLFGGPAEFATVVNNVMRDGVAAAIAVVRAL